MPDKSNKRSAPALPELPSERLQQIQERLLAWYREHRRPLPWRAHKDPYAIWVSEVMLQQTQVQTVWPYFERWLTAFPTVEALAHASEEEVLRHWQGLGYYSRARGLHKGARRVLEDGGRIPSEVPLLRALPGIGPYTAGAIASIAFNRDAPTVDGNIARVLTRLFALPGTPAMPPLKDQLWALAQKLLPRGRAGDFNQALMELGAVRCTPQKPACTDCPLRPHCLAFQGGEPSRYPEPAKRPSLTHVRSVASVAKRRARVLVARHGSDAARWKGLWVFPHVERRTRESAEHAAERALLEFAGLAARSGARVTELVHHVTRYRIALELYECHVQAGRVSPGACAELRWVTLAELSALPMPSPHRKLATFLQTSSQARLT
jgi:A/G-specific adenine glycosylase